MKYILIKLLAFMMLFVFSSSVMASEHVAEVKSSTHKEETYQSKSMGEMVKGFLLSTGIVAFVNPDPEELNAHGEKMKDFHKSWGRLIMIFICFVLFYLAIAKGFEPL